MYQPVKPVNNHWVMDYETIVNCFVGVFVHHKDSSISKVFVIHGDKNDLYALIMFLKECSRDNQWHISYNGLSFDAQISSYILANQSFLLSLSTEDVITKLYNFANSVIKSKDTGSFLPFSPWSIPIKQIDLFKMNHWDNKAKMSSLKWIQYSMDWENVEEMPHKHYEPVTDEQTLNKVISYCFNDVYSTRDIFIRSKEQIELRRQLTTEYKIDLYSASEPRISKELFLHFLEQRTGIPKSELKQGRTHRTHIVLADCILPYVKFKTAEFKAVHDYFLKTVITSTKDKLKHTLVYKGVKTDYGLGGIHGAVKEGLYKPDDGWTIITSDVVSYYPNLAIKNRFAPEHINKDVFCFLYEWIFEERTKIPKSNPKNYVYKIILNSTYGLTGDENSFLYDPKMTMQITINGQLLLSMLYEMICEEIPTAIPLMQNTDGLETMLPTSELNKYMEICKKWQDITQLTLEHDEYKKMVIRDVNNYIAVNTKDKVKCKGVFEWEDLDQKKVAVLHKNKSFLIIPKAVYAYFVNGIRPEEFIAQNRKLHDYCAGVKSNGEWHFETRELIDDVPEKYKTISIEEKRQYLLANGWEQSWSDDNWVRHDAMNKEASTGLHTEYAFRITVKKESVVKKTKLQKIVRYFISTNGKKIIKCHADGREIQVEAGPWLQTVVNKLPNNASVDDYSNVNFQYYIDEIYKQINQIEEVKLKTYVQLSLF
jgi:hypothetical protein